MNFVVALTVHGSSFKGTKLPSAGQHVSTHPLAAFFQAKSTNMNMDYNLEDTPLIWYGMRLHVS